jgi:hypothetical protein
MTRGVKGIRMSCATETCPSCGKSPEGRDFVGARRESGAAEHVCWWCQIMYVRAMRRMIDRRNAMHERIDVPLPSPVPCHMLKSAPY